MRGPVHRFLTADHERLEACLDAGDYEAFRAGLLRHIAMEEKVLMPFVKRAQNGEPAAVAAQLRADHSALATLLVPTPTDEILGIVRSILVEHNPLEEDPRGLYDLCDELAGDEAEALVARCQAVPEVPVAAHFDGPRVQEHLSRLLAARARR